MARRHSNSARLAERAKKNGRPLEPVWVATSGRKIAETFWGASWCQNLEHYSDFANRIPRGRTYLRNGSVIDLRIGPGLIEALVSGSEIYTVSVQVQKLANSRWKSLCSECAGGIDSLVELLKGRFSKGVMEVLCRSSTGMFPEPGQITMSCSCPDDATMCKHVAAVLYGVGVRLDERPELLFTLRQVDQSDLVSAPVGQITNGKEVVSADLDGLDLEALFGIELEAPTPALRPRNGRAKRTTSQKVPNTSRASEPQGPDRTPVESAGTSGKHRPRRKSVPKVVDTWVTAKELAERNIPPHVVQGWLRTGLMEHSGQRGIYVRTAASEALVAEYLARPVRKRR